MEYSKYSKDEFEKAGINSTQARALADKLEEDVLQALDAEIGAAFAKVISRLNKEGHDLSQYSEIVPGEYEFRGKQSDGNCGLRLACVVVISASYSHTVDE
ncbi:MAG: hypothetical protein H6936_14245 [Burkholderiales bacterium]|nr:hypothetical protein [Nitrosomonas sp.]MCP5275978.1 hypothetical protein [Burkholderiales bacterium]